MFLMFGLVCILPCVFVGPWVLLRFRNSSRPALSDLARPVLSFQRHPRNGSRSSRALDVSAPHRTPDRGIPCILPDRYSLLHATAKPPQRLSTTDFTQRTKILQSKLFCISISLGVLWTTGGLIRLQSPRSPQYLPQLAGMILFHPASMIVIWLGWKTGLRLAEVLSACLIATLSFGIWNAIMLPGLPWDLVGRTLISNAVHWALFLGVGIAIARYLQWGTSIGIWSENRKARGAPNVAPARLSINKLFLLMVLAAGVTVAYKSLALQPSRVGFRNSPLHYFPLQLKPVISAILGGFLVSFHWLITIAILKLRSYRLAGLILLFPFVMFLRWFTGELYWDAPLGFSGFGCFGFGRSA